MLEALKGTVEPREHDPDKAFQTVIRSSTGIN